MVCVKVIGNHTGITLAGSQGQFELNVFKPLIAHNILQSIDLLSDSSNNFSKFCINTFLYSTGITFLNNGR